MSIKVGVELPLFLVMFAIGLSGSVSSNFLIFRTCTVLLGYNETDCGKLGTGASDNETEELEKKVEPLSNTISMTITVISDVFPAIACLFLGPWSDRHGRKKIILVSLFGLVLNCMVKTVVSFMPSASPWYLVAECLPTALTGGIPTFIMCVLCYITDITTEDNRGVRMGLFECVIISGAVLGSLLSPQLFKVTNYSTVFAICVLCAFLAYLSACFLKESVVATGELQNNTNVFTTKSLKEMYATLSKERPNQNRPLLLLVLGSVLLSIFIGVDSNAFNFLRLTLNWSLEKYSIFSGVNTAVSVLGTVFGIYVLHKLLGIPESVLIFFGTLTLIFGSLMVGLARADWYIYTAAVVKCFGGAMNPMYRTLLSKIIQPDELGKIFSIAIVMDTLANVLATPFFTVIYNRSIDVFPGSVYLVKAGLYTFDAALVLAMVILSRVDRREDTNTLIST